MRKYFKDWGMFLNSSDFVRYIDNGKKGHERQEGEGYEPKAQATIASDSYHAHYRFLMRLAT